jgi:hypothetical protein
MRILHSKKLIFVSKPRCGSTSIRRILNKLMQEGDEKCDFAGQYENLHPHMTAPSIHNYIMKKGLDVKEYKTFTVTRNPLEMLWSYFKYFQPDVNGKYNFNGEHIDKLASFDNWLLTGKVGLGEAWKEFVPCHISELNLSPLSLDAHILNKRGENVCDKVFKMEERHTIFTWLKTHYNVDVDDTHVNESLAEQIPFISDEVKRLLHVNFSLDFELYNL